MDEDSGLETETQVHVPHLHTVTEESDHVFDPVGNLQCAAFCAGADEAQGESRNLPDAGQARARRRQGGRRYRG